MSQGNTDFAHFVISMGYPAQRQIDHGSQTGACRYRPCQTGFRFSTKARMPSTRSSLLYGLTPSFNRSAAGTGKPLERIAVSFIRRSDTGAFSQIASAIRNAKAFLSVQKEFGTFDRYIWQFVGGKPRVNSWQAGNKLPASTPQSDAMSKDLKKRGFNFVGSTICYAFMQATGMVNDHVVECFRYPKK